MRTQRGGSPDGGLSDRRGLSGRAAAASPLTALACTHDCPDTFRARRIGRPGRSRRRCRQRLGPRRTRPSFSPASNLFAVYLMMQCHEHSQRHLRVRTGSSANGSDADYCVWVVLKFLARKVSHCRGTTRQNPIPHRSRPRRRSRLRRPSKTLGPAWAPSAIGSWDLSTASTSTLTTRSKSWRTRGAPHGVVVATDDEDTFETTRAVRPRIAARLLWEGWLTPPGEASITSIRCRPGPWVRTYRGGGSDDRFVTIPANESIRGRFTARADSSFGCTTGVYIDGESIDEFDLFFDGRQTKTRTADIDAEGRTHLKVISSCPWTLRLTGQAE